ncbi:ankyrin repeat and IBR domain-containing protein 1 isoform X4 [Heterodontus francisci]|uniref:ankyrin repeat and IBR domain-containing protein 1 isoform X4 n=1 Tax=Heterodontus francisci TaxID=7792 RepID=UPI00355C3DC0
MGNTTTKFRKALINGDESLAYQLYESNPQFKESLDPNTSYGEPYQHNTPLHYAARHAMSKLLRIFLFNKDGNPNKRNVHNETALHLLCMGPHIMLPEAALQPRLARPNEDDGKRAECLQLILKWKGARLDQGEFEKAESNATDNKKFTPLHYAAASGMKTCVELLVKYDADLFAENENRDTPCDCAEKQHHKDLALNLESRMVFSRDPEAEEVEAEYAAVDRKEPYEGLRPQDLRKLKDMLIVETADMLQAPLFTAEALLRAHDWDREKLLEAWMLNPEDCCQRSGIQMPIPPPSGYNAWDTLPSPRTPRTTRSSVTSPDDISLSPTDEDALVCGICMCNISVFEDPVDVPCGHEFCRGCWEGFLNIKIQEGEAHNIICPAFDCFQLVPVDIIENLVSREMDKRYLQFDIKAFVENNPVIRWCPTPGCERAVRLTCQRSGSTMDQLSFPLLSAPAVDCGKGHLFCWECLGEAHEPCDCQTWKNWLQKITEMKPEELAGVNEAFEDAANCLWLLSNSKPCANCKSPIQKNEGCNHMQCAKCKYDFCWICLEEWKKHSSSTGGYYRCTRYEVIQQVEEQSKEMTAEAEKKHKKFQELDRFMHYYTRFKNHEHSYKLEQRLLKTAKEKMEQLSRALKGVEGGSPDTTFIEEAVLELLKTRRILKCSYPYGFFLEPKSTKKEIFELMQEYAEFQYRRRHRQRRRDMHSLRSNTPDPEDPSDSTIDTHEGNSRRHGTSMVSSASMSILHSSSLHDYTPVSHSENQDSLQALSSLDDDDPNILLAIQLSLQESALAAGGEPQEFLNNELSLGAIGTSLPSRLDAAQRSTETARALSNSQLVDLEGSLMRLGNSDPYPNRFSSSQPSDVHSRFFPSPEGTESTDADPVMNANLLGNIMAWFHDMNPQSIALIPSASSETDINSHQLSSGEEQGSSRLEEMLQSLHEDHALFEAAVMNEGRGTQADEAYSLESIGATKPEPQAETSGVSENRSVIFLGDDSQQDNSSNEWEEQIHLV